MKFMLLCYDDEEAWNNAGEGAQKQAMNEAVSLARELHASGQYLNAAPLQSVSVATCVRMRNEKRLVTDGPFAETREVLGGFYLIDVNDFDEALRIAARHPGARLGAVEVRPVLEIAGLPTDSKVGPQKEAMHQAPVGMRS
jgi:hypothetical protein